MNYRDWMQYNRCGPVKEDSFAPDEAFVQRLWFEELYRNPLLTTDGRKIRVLQPGFWNREAGPDFYHAAIVGEDGKLRAGAVEIDLGPQHWRQHHHAENPHYNDVILQVVWRAGGRAFFPATAGGGEVRQVELSSQLKFPEAELRGHFHSSPAERELGARAGRCGGSLALLADGAAQGVLRDAGEFRFARKQELFRLKAAALGEDQALWLGVAEAMGFARNRGAFRGLAQRVAIGVLAELEHDCQREALLFGVAGFMPFVTLPDSLAASDYVRRLWDEWWKLRAGWRERVIPRGIWQLGGVRPLNRPERRVALLARLASPENWRRFSRLARLGDAALLRDFCAGLEHEFWGRHCTLASLALPAPAALLGEDRLLALLFNTIWPLAARDNPLDVAEHLRAAAGGPSNRLVKIAAQRLLGGRRLRGVRNSLLAQEGLLQIYRDFCLQDYSRCRDCAFPSLVEKYL
jgi:hypothetical protein